MLNKQQPETTSDAPVTPDLTVPEPAAVPTPDAPVAPDFGMSVEEKKEETPAPAVEEKPEPELTFDMPAPAEVNKTEEDSAPAFSFDEIGGLKWEDLQKKQINSEIQMINAAYKNAKLPDKIKYFCLTCFSLVRNVKTQKIEEGSL